MEDGYAFILEMQRMHIDAEKRFLVSVMESCGETKAINEGMSEFFAKIKEIINKAIQWIKDTVSKFIAKIKKFFKDKSKDNASFRDKLKKAIDDFKDSDEFVIKGYKFTIDAMDANIKNASVPSILKQITDLTSYTSHEKQRGELKSKIEDIYSNLKDGHEEHVMEYRRTILGDTNSKERISKSDFSEELFKIFRDGSKDKIDITVNKTYLQTIYDEYFNNSFEKSSNDIGHRGIDKLESLKNCMKLEMSTEVEEDDIAAKITHIRKSYCDLTQEFCNVILQAVASETQAIKECLDQYTMTFKKITKTTDQEGEDTNTSEQESGDK